MRRPLRPAPLVLLVAALTGVFAAPTLPDQNAYSKCASTRSDTASIKVVRVVPSTEGQVEAMRQFLLDHPTIDSWLEPSFAGRPVDILGGPVELCHLREFLGAESLEARDMIGNVSGLIQHQEMQMFDSRRSKADLFGWDTYHTLDEIDKWIRGLVQKYPSQVSLIELERTYEGRNIVGVKIKFGEDLPVAFLEAGIHAREWITPATATYFINEILTGEEEAVRALRAYEWHVFPSTNPDGYAYTHNSNRLWRKSRSKFNRLCPGADLNRNWPFHWREKGSSPIPCAETYAGARAESEYETVTMRRYLDSQLERRKGAERESVVKLYISLHSYSQLVMFPWGWTSDPAEAHNDLHSVAELAVEALAKRHGTKFTFGAIARTLYAASGSTIDYTYAKGVKYSYVFELRDQGNYGFLLPIEQIKPAAEEAVDAIIVIASEASKRK